ncbi:MAG: uracil-DNA glycosylase [Endomicrobiia bacterium]|nr:uracil-DNA glycosylase [Endomicrobiia bacterium]
MVGKKLLKSHINDEALWGVDDFCGRQAVKGKPASSKVSPDKARALAELFKKNKNCRKCPLGNARLNFVFGVGNPDSPLIFVGEGPGFDEDHKGEPFVGRAGQLLNKIIAAMKLSREDVYIANIAKCHPMIDPTNPDKRGNDRPPTIDEMAGCMPILEEQLKIIRPRVVCALGSTAAKGMLRSDDTIGKLRGNVFDFKVGGHEMKIVPTYHPAALLRNPSLKKICWEDMRLVMRLLSSN